MESDDELDLISDGSRTLVAPTPVDSAASSSFGDDSKRTLRTRGAMPTNYSDSKRKRKPSFSNTENLSKKPKVQEIQAKLTTDVKKALTLEANATRANIEVARKCWLRRHRDLFTPLLPHPSTFLNMIGSTEGTEQYIPLHQIDNQPKLVTGGKMKDYQLEGLSYLVWMYRNGMNCILGDEMGLGKTLQTLSLLAYVKETAKGHQDPHLIICPLSVLSSWFAEAARWVPSFTTMRFHGDRNERTRIKDGVRAGKIKFDIMITTYESYVAEDSWFKTRRWTFCVLDEGHRIKNADTALAGKLQGLGSSYKLILTGTPVQNNLIELWGILHWLYPTIFTGASERLFKDSFDLTRGLYSLEFLDATKKLLSTIMLRRTKADVEFSVPPREELTVFLPMTEAQRFWTYKLLTRMDESELKDIFSAASEQDKTLLGFIESQANENKDKNQNRWKKLMNLLMQLRKVCDHPYMLPDAEPEPYHIGEHIVASSSKLVAVDKLLKDILPKGERVLIFSQFTSMLDLLEDFMRLREFPYARLDGSTPRARRALDIKLFQQDKSPHQVFLISTKAGGLGINLTKATTVVMFDSDWNPQNDLQAIARAHRIGQTKVVKVYRLICQGSVEDQMLDRLRRKLFLSLKVMASDGQRSDSDSQNPALHVTELMSILRKGSSALSSSDVGMDLATFLDAPIEAILKESRERDDVRTAKVLSEVDDEHANKDLLADAEEEERRLLAGVAQVKSRLFEGKVVKSHKENRQIAREWEELQGHRADSQPTSVNESPTKDASKPPQKSPKKKKFEHEDWCICCRDGGEVTLCTSCPRVFHAECCGYTKAYVQRALSVTCPQHKCTSCHRATASAGGMLFRCETCPQAFCEDCLGNDDIDPIGETLPQFLLLGYRATSTAYYIRCDDCQKRAIDDPVWWKDWQDEITAARKKLQAQDE